MNERRILMKHTPGATADQHKSAITRLQASSTVDMSASPIINTVHTAYQGAIFHVDEEEIRLPLQGGGFTESIKRQVVKHAPAVVMLVHDCQRDTYLLEREYRAGSHTFAFGIPAGLIDEGDADTHAAALRELHEETGVTVNVGSASDEGQHSATPATPATSTAPSYSIDEVGSFYSSEGMTDELVTIMVIHLKSWQMRHTHFDRDEHVESTWVDWETLNSIGIRSSNSIIALKHEALRRVTEGKHIEA